MNEDQVITNAESETIEEVVNLDDTPANSEEGADKVDSDNTDDTTSQYSEDEDENFLGTFKTKEDADKGFKDAQAKITEQGNRIKELEKELNKQGMDILNPANVEKRAEVAKSQVFAEYKERLHGLGYKYGAYLPNDAEINNEMDIVRNLPSEQAALFVAEMMNIQNECSSKLKNQINGIYAEATKIYDEAKAKDKERFNNGKTGEMIYNAWYNPPETIDEVAKLFDDYKALVIEDYIKEQAAKQEDDLHKKKLSTNANTKAKFKSDHIFTREEIGKMTTEEFAKYEDIIDKQVAAGLIHY